MLSESLSELGRKFESWRIAGRPGHKVPEELKSRALELLSEHKTVELEEVLGISSNTIRNWRKQLSEESPVFIHLPGIVKNTEKLLLKVSNGSLTLEGELSLSDWHDALGLLRK